MFFSIAGLEPGGEERQEVGRTLAADGEQTGPALLDHFSVLGRPLVGRQPKRHPKKFLQLPPKRIRNRERGNHNMSKLDSHLILT